MHHSMFIHSTFYAPSCNYNHVRPNYQLRQIKKTARTPRYNMTNMNHLKNQPAQWLNINATIPNGTIPISNKRAQTGDFTKNLHK